MTAAMPTLVIRLNRRRLMLGMSYPILAERSGVSEPTIKRILGGQVMGASFGNVEKVAAALGVSVELREQDDGELRRSQARKKAERVARMVQGTSALESQAVDADTYQRLVENSYHELLAGPSRRLWSD